MTASPGKRAHPKNSAPNTADKVYNWVVFFH